MVTACFDKREHLGGKHLHQKMPVGDNHPKNLGLGCAPFKTVQTKHLFQKTYCCTLMRRNGRYCHQKLKAL